MQRVLIAIAAALLPLTIAAPARAQGPSPSPERPGPAPAARAVPVARAAAIASSAGGSIALDGRLDEAAWAAAEPVTRLIQNDPAEGRPASEATEVRIAYDAEALYVGARLHDRGAILAPLGRRDMPGENSDWFGVHLDSYHDHRTAYSFWVNPANVRADGVVGANGFDPSWEAVWETATSVDSAGWTVEMRIPFSQLRFTPAPEQQWGFQLWRVIRRNQETAVFAHTPKNESGGIAAYGHLEGLRGVTAGRRLEVLPYTVARTERIEPAGNPFRSDAEYGASFGLDLKYRLTPGLTLDATVNPDFGTVEADPAEVNLSAFETQRGERRPFFLEGAEIFDFGRGSLSPGAPNRGVFYSRRIGRRPQLGAPTGAADVPEQATILGAAKLSGKTAGWSLGTLAAVTQEERARWLAEDGGAHTSVAEPMTGYFVGRAVREMREGQSSVGVIATAVRRRLDEDAAASLRSSAYAGGVDFSHEWARRAWRLSGYAVASRIAGSPGAIAAAQTTSARYLQRPDTDHLGFDPERTSLSGYSALVQLSRQSGEHWRGDLALSATTPGYEINDLGFQQRADQRVAFGRLIYLENTPGRLFRSYRFDAVGWVMTNGAGERVGSNLFLGTEWRLSNYWRYVLNASYAFRNTHDRLTRGGPAALYPAEGRLYTELNTDSRKPVSLSGGLYLRGSGEAGWERDLWLSLGLKPSSRWNVSIGPELNRQGVGAQYVATAADSLASATYGSRYVFARMDQTSLSLTTRLNWTFTPDLSLQVYAQPFITAADFGGYKELEAPGTFDFAVYGRDRGTVTPAGDAFRIDPDGEGPAGAFTVGERFGQRDFNLRSLKGNAVLRWEWRPGSTLYLAWQQARADTELGTGTFRLGRDRAALFRTQPDNVFILKVSYWLNP
jgi:Domain of unknown function (DUF5916)/Carbohydrate family 9 binding domain-like